MRAKAMMVVGTSSHSGKSWMATAICRHLRRRGVRVAPFKAQNMSLNSFVCADGGEIGRAQAVQAEACGLAPTTDMNPILLKPTSSTGSQVIVHGKVWKQLGAGDYYSYYESLLGEVTAAFARLAASYEFIVMEGAGAAAEVNLRSRDLVNLPLAERLDVPALLVADIDRGGVFASVVGTFSLLEPREKELLRAFVINRFRGDRALFEDGREILETRTDRPCLGVLPYADDIRIDEEDSVSLEERSSATQAAGLDVVVIRLPRIANFTDFRLLNGARYITEPADNQPDCIIVPGSKNTLEDLQWLHERGLSCWIRQCHARGSSVWGVCGGYQMLGRRVADPLGVETSSGAVDGLALLPIETTLLAQKATRQVRARCALNGAAFEAYEIHMGETEAIGDSPFAYVDGAPEGYYADGIVGTYLHGALEHPPVLTVLLAEVARRRGKKFDARTVAGQDSKQQHYERLADWFEKNVDLTRFEELYLQ